MTTPALALTMHDVGSYKNISINYGFIGSEAAEAARKQV